MLVKKFSTSVDEDELNLVRNIMSLDMIWSTAVFVFKDQRFASLITKLIDVRFEQHYTRKFYFMHNFVQRYFVGDKYVF